MITPVGTKEFISHSQRFGAGYSKVLTAIKDDPDVEGLFRASGQNIRVKTSRNPKSVIKYGQPIGKSNAVHIPPIDS